MCDVKSLLAKALKKKKFTDVKFKCSNEDSPGTTVIEAHKPILMMASPVFEAMFNPENEKFTLTEEIIEITDIHAKAFETLIRIIYGENVENGSILMAVELYYAAEKYDIKEAKEVAKSFIDKHLHYVKNIIPVYELCISKGNDEYQKLCIEYMKQNTQAMLNCASFLYCQPTTLVKIFSLDKLNIDSELTLVEAYTKYVKKNHESKENIGKALKYIRFLTINPDDLLRVTFFMAEVLLTIIRIAKSYESEDQMPLNLSRSRKSRGKVIRPVKTDEGVTKLINDFCKCKNYNCTSITNADRYKQFQDIYKKYNHLNFASYTDEDYQILMKIDQSSYFEKARRLMMEQREQKMI